MPKCVSETYAQRSGETGEEPLARAMKGPEIGAIMVSTASVGDGLALIAFLDSPTLLCSRCCSRLNPTRERCRST
jgi:hypothetical protein